MCGRTDRAKELRLHAASHAGRLAYARPPPPFHHTRARAHAHTHTQTHARTHTRDCWRGEVLTVDHATPGLTPRLPRPAPPCKRFGDTCMHTAGVQLGAADLPFLVAELSGFCNEYDTHTFLTHCKFSTSTASINRHPPPPGLNHGRYRGGAKLRTRCKACRQSQSC